ncbi:MAG: hypothetical protein RR568_00095 [Anaerorhabdus sp.]|uniref:hypothetical protein n=2 Tax=Anaerorhabdus sp. TaxID=1872524 RepID=UPI002FC9100E
MRIMPIITLFIAFYICSTSIGMMMNKVFTLPFIKYYFPIGFVAIFGIYELLMFLPLFLNLSSIFSYLSGFIILILILTSFIYNKKKLLDELLSRKSLIILFLFIFTILFIYLFGYVGDFRLDHNFYISYIQENMISPKLNYINILQSGYTTMGNIYAQDGFYHLIALLSNIFHFDGYLFSIWFTPFLYTIFASTTLLEAIEHLTSKKLYKYVFSFLSILLVFNPHLIVNSMMGNLYRDYVIILILLLLIKDSCTKNQTIFLFFAFLTGICVHSTFVFLAIIILFAKLIHLLLSKSDEKQIKWYCIYSFFVVQNAFLLLIERFSHTSKPIIISISFLLTIILLYALYKLWNFKNFQKYLKVTIIIGIIGLYVFSLSITFNGHPVFNYHDFFYEVFLLKATEIEIISNIHLTFGYVISLIFLIINFKSKHFINILLFVTWVVFYNPITISTISTYLTNVVYFRIAFIFINFFVLFYIIVQFKNKLIYFTLILILLITFCLPYQYGLKFKNPIDFNMEYRMENDAVLAFNTLDQLGINYVQLHQTKPNTFVTDFRTPYLTKNIHYIYTIYNWRSSFRGKQYQITNDLTHLYEAVAYSSTFDIPLEMIDEAITNSKINFILLDTFQTSDTYEKLNRLCKVEYDNNSFIIYSCNE